ncbi:DUF2158 domain-containing protein [Mesorhizobium sp. Cs1330R2N1]|uniref:DUF2158 domain-containing protein n=2 Tax=Mesorhizobium argentiipisi TaxID=3015175 RepID=A0ABU8KLY5_9HYPH
MPNSLNTGDVVRLKSGGPKMTMSDGAASDAYLCHWFNREDDLWTPQHAGFKPEQLVVKADQSPSAADRRASAAMIPLFSSSCGRKSADAADNWVFRGWASPSTDEPLTTRARTESSGSSPWLL